MYVAILLYSGDHVAVIIVTVMYQNVLEFVFYYVRPYNLLTTLNSDLREIYSRLGEHFTYSYSSQQ